MNLESAKQSPRLHRELARKAFQRGEYFYSPWIELSTPQVPEVAEIYQAVFDETMKAITSQGWKLHTWTVVDRSGNPVALPLFVR